MRYHELVALVEERAGLTREEAFRAADATISTLGQELSLEETHDVASQLPRELKDVLRPVLKGSAPTAQPMSREDFLDRVSRRADIPLSDAEPRARAVFAALREALSDGEWEDVVMRLPDSFAPLLP